MSLLGVLGRALTGLPFVKFGLEAATAPGMRVDMAAPLLGGMRTVVPVPVEDEMIVRANGAAQAIGGAMIAAGVATRPAAAIVLASLIPTTAAGHAFWAHEDPGARTQQQVQFLKNTAMAGALVSIIAAGRR